MERSSRNFSRPQAKENSRQYLLLQTDILQKTVLGAPGGFRGAYIGERGEVGSFS